MQDGLEGQELWWRQQRTWSLKTPSSRLTGHASMRVCMYVSVCMYIVACMCWFHVCSHMEKFSSCKLLRLF